MKIIIIGGVAGGASTATRLRRLDEQAEIILFERGDYLSYANCGLPYYIGNVISDRNKLFVQSEEGFKNRFNIDTRIKTEVLSINRKDKTITAKNLISNQEYTETYDKLVISTGAKPFVPNIEGIQDYRIFTLRNVSDSDRIKKYISEKNPKKITIIGAGFIGLEMAENLLKNNNQVYVIEMTNQVMAPIDFSMAQIVHQHLKSKNIHLLLEETVEKFDGNENSINIQFKSGKSLETELVIWSVGVRPESELARKAELEIGSLGGITTNEYMQTSDKDIYAIGDVVEVLHPIMDKKILIPLAGPANKQGRLVADNIVTNNTKQYKGTIGTSIAKVFDLTVATTGVAAKTLKKNQIPYLSSYTHSANHASYYPDSSMLDIKIVFSPENGKLLGAQIIGIDGVDKRIDLFSQIIKNNGSIYDLQEIEQAYAPPYSSAKDPVNMAGFVAENILSQKVNIIHWRELMTLNRENIQLIDVRTKEEYEMGHIENSINIPLDEIRNRLFEIEKNKKVILYCAVGLRGYLAFRILSQSGFKDIFNLSGGYKTFSLATKNFCNNNDISQNHKREISEEETLFQNKKTIDLDACGLQCPGPIMLLKENYDNLNPGEQLNIKVTDIAFSEDLKGWCTMVGANLLDIQQEKGIISARIEKPLIKKNLTPNEEKNHKTLIVFSDDLDKALASFVIANGALAAGKKVSIFFTFWGLNVIKKTTKPNTQKDFMAKMFDFMLPSNSKKLNLSKMKMGGLGKIIMRKIMKNKNIESLETLMNKAHNSGAEFIACSMSMDVMGIKKEELLDNITIGGVATYLDRAEKANVNLFI